MDTKDNKKTSGEELNIQDPENNSLPKKNDKEDLPGSSTNKSGKNGG
ncbi:hypothetical protein [Chryseobacterium sp.]|nr:hypothetical protein [Chryseobacterium sp.]MBV8327418.1 hypothetical protein [Chryseobacterium sp.]